MKVIVITGSTRGIGYGLADSFLSEGCRVTITGRKAEDVDKAVETLSVKHGADRLSGCACDVRQVEDLQDLWDTAKDRFGRVDVWINNAGIGHSKVKAWELSPQEVEAVIETNLLGVLYGSRVAVRGMLEQGFGSLFNMEGMGSDGRKQDGMTFYGTTKCGVRYFTQSLVEESKDSPLVVGAISPGMVVTDLVVGRLEGSPEEIERIKRIFNILADRVETVTPWLARKILENDKTGARISWMSRGKMLGRFLAAPFRKRDLFDGL